MASAWRRQHDLTSGSCILPGVRCENQQTVREPVRGDRTKGGGDQVERQSCNADPVSKRCGRLGCFVASNSRTCLGDFALRRGPYALRALRARRRLHWSRHQSAPAGEPGNSPSRMADASRYAVASAATLAASAATRREVVSGMLAGAALASLPPPLSRPSAAVLPELMALRVYL